jgi:hypothetical protein
MLNPVFDPLDTFTQALTVARRNGYDMFVTANNHAENLQLAKDIAEREKMPYGFVMQDFINASRFLEAMGNCRTRFSRWSAINYPSNLNRNLWICFERESDAMIAKMLT